MTKVKKSRKKLIFCCCLLVLPLLQFAIFYVGVNINSIVLAFREYDADAAHYVGFKNFSNVLNEIFTLKNWGVMAKNSLLIWLLGLAIQLPLTLIVSYFIYKNAKLGGWLKVVLFAPSIMSVMVTVILYQYFVEAAIPELWKKVFGKDIAGLLSTDAKTSFITIFMYGVWSGFGTSMLLYSNAMSGISESIVEAAKLDGESFFGEFVHITFPMIFSTFKTLFVVGIAGIFTNQFMLFEFYGLYAETGLHTIGYYLYQQTMLTNNVGYPRVAAMGVLLTLVAVPFALAARWLMNRLDPMEDRR